ncbi:MAG: hypothetical protein JNK02_12185 [Planctomycetes bacterium]|nr:hypothetical protein [Planctomycetota bacterium]
MRAAAPAAHHDRARRQIAGSRDRGRPCSPPSPTRGGGLDAAPEAGLRAARRAWPPARRATELGGRRLRDAVDDDQRAVIRWELDRAEGNAAAAACALGMHRGSLRHRAQRPGLS